MYTGNEPASHFKSTGDPTAPLNLHTISHVSRVLAGLVAAILCMYALCVELAAKKLAFDYEASETGRVTGYRPISNTRFEWIEVELSTSGEKVRLLSKSFVRLYQPGEVVALIERIETRERRGGWDDNFLLEYEIDSVLHRFQVEFLLVAMIVVSIARCVAGISSLRHSNLRLGF